LGEKIPLDVVNSETGEIIILANRKITKTFAAQARGRLRSDRNRSVTDSQQDQRDHREL